MWSPGELGLYAGEWLVRLGGDLTETSKKREERPCVKACKCKMTQSSRMSRACQEEPEKRDELKTMRGPGHPLEDVTCRKRVVTGQFLGLLAAAASLVDWINLVGWSRAHPPTCLYGWN